MSILVSCVVTPYILAHGYISEEGLTHADKGDVFLRDADKHLGIPQSKPIFLIGNSSL
jgi:hypothetical protein